MPTARTPAERNNDHNLVLLVGQLMAATEASSDGIKAVSEETRANTKALITAAGTLDAVQRSLATLERIVKDGNGVESLVNQIRSVREENGRLRAELTTACADLAALRTRVDGYHEVEQQVMGGRKLAVRVFTAIVWVIGAVAGIYTFIRGILSGSK